MHFLWNKVNNQILGEFKRFKSPEKKIFLRGVTSGERFKKNFYCSVYEVISQHKWPSNCEWLPSLVASVRRKKARWSDWHFEYIWNVSDHFINFIDIAMCSEGGILVHQTITQFSREIVFLRWFSGNQQLLHYSHEYRRKWGVVMVHAIPYCPLSWSGLAWCNINISFSKKGWQWNVRLGWLSLTVYKISLTFSNKD